MAKDMGMRIDQPGQYQRAADIDDFAGPGQVGRDRGDLAIGDRDVLDAVDALYRIDDPPALRTSSKPAWPHSPITCHRPNTIA
jgi:hypothetical protein